MKAIVLAGGFGTRLRPLTENLPKPMLPVAGRPMLDYVVSQLKNFGIDGAVFTLGFMPETIKNHAGAYKDFDAVFTSEKIPLGTAGGVKNAEKYLDDNFIVISGDALSDIDLDKLMFTHKNSGADVTMAVTEVENPTLYGVVRADGEKITAFIEKPPTAAFGNLVNAGVYAVKKQALCAVPDNKTYDFSKNLFPKLLRKGKLAAMRHSGYWSDIGDKESYFWANMAMKSGAFYKFVNSNADKKRVFIPNNGNFSAIDSLIMGKSEGSVIGCGAVILPGAEVTHCVVMDGAVVKGIHKNRIISGSYIVDICGYGKQNIYSLNKYDKLSQIGI